MKAAGNRGRTSDYKFIYDYYIISTCYAIPYYIVETNILDIPISVPIIGFENKKCKRIVKVELCILMAGHIA